MFLLLISGQKRGRPDEGGEAAHLCLENPCHYDISASQKVGRHLQSHLVSSVNHGKEFHSQHHVGGPVSEYGCPAMSGPLLQNESPVLCRADPIHHKIALPYCLAPVSPIFHPLDLTQLALEWQHCQETDKESPLGPGQMPPFLRHFFPKLRAHPKNVSFVPLTSLTGESGQVRVSFHKRNYLQTWRIWGLSD